ncbi:hypothetical protein Dsin_026153 [Dipteronia sinensis]|uniref:Uncharacterized protein n=1 Tax=Dipteronia sinensis TaxID=43782 RepID=A0AAD9ZYL9_9ROSI|nr:hypothetical protein Dsin_026153 [Dipteronia sinensis]
MIQLIFTKAFNLRKTIAALSGLAQTATVFYSADAMSLLATHPDGHVIAALRILPTDSASFKCSKLSAITGIDIVKLYRYLNNSQALNSAVLYGDQKNFKYTLAMRYVGMQAFRIMQLELIQPDNVHINFENQERKYDVKVGILSTEFRNMIVRLAAIGDIADVTITATQVKIGAGNVHFVLYKVQDCIIEGDIGVEPVHFHPRIDDLISISEGVVLAERVWIYHSNSAPPMLHCPFPPVGDLMYYFV